MHVLNAVANLIALAWALAAWAAAAYAGVRALRLAGDEIPASVLCLFADASRWLFGWPRSSVNWRPREFITLGVSLAVLCCLLAFVRVAGVLVDLAGAKLSGVWLVMALAPDIVTGSALIVLHCGIALRFAREAAS